MRLVGSLVVHAVIGVVLFAIARQPAPPAPAAAVAIEVVDLGLPPAPVKAIDVTIAPDGSSGGGGATPGAKERTIASRETARSTDRSRTIVASREIARSNDRARRTDSQPAADAATNDAAEDPRGAITFDAPFEDPRGAIDAPLDDSVGSLTCGARSACSGDGRGRGRGTGSGIGFGDGGGVPSAAPPPPPPPAPKLSKARPARLIFPSRQRDVDDGELYVMRVTVDADGFVSGATLVRGFGGHRDDVASAQIWRFRYDPARDDDGQPIRSILEQRFLVQ